MIGTLQICPRKRWLSTQKPLHLSKAWNKRNATTKKTWLQRLSKQSKKFTKRKDLLTQTVICVSILYLQRWIMMVSIKTLFSSSRDLSKTSFHLNHYQSVCLWQETLTCSVWILSQGRIKALNLRWWICMLYCCWRKQATNAAWWLITSSLLTHWKTHSL